MPKQEEHASTITVHILLLQGQNVLLVEQTDIESKERLYNCITGSLREHESLKSAAIREVNEAVGIDVQSEHLQIVEITHQYSVPSHIDFYLATGTWSGELRNANPEKYAHPQWFPMKQVPENTLSSLKQALQNYMQGIFYAEYSNAITDNQQIIASNISPQTAGAPSTDSALKNIDREAIMHILKECYDPEIPVNIVDLGLIQDIDINGFTGHVVITLTPTSMGCPSIPEFVAEIEAKVSTVPEVASCKVELSFSPAWTPDRMTEDARYELGMI